MNVRKQRWSEMVAVMLSALLGLMTGVAKEQQENRANPGILPPQSHSYGASHGEWVVKWWQWMGPIPAEVSPGCDLTGEYATSGQSNHVWFLADCPPWLLGPEETITRTCNIPTGKALFFPVCMLPWITVPGVDFPIEDPPIDPLEWTLENLDWIREVMASLMDGVSEMSCEIDGRVVKDLERYYVQSPVFGMYAEDVGPPPGYYPACIADGVWLMLAPLSVGHHTIHFRVVQELAPEANRYVDITYELTVVPAK